MNDKQMELISDCCGAPLIGSLEDPFCRDCKEHCRIADDEDTVKRFVVHFVLQRRWFMEIKTGSKLIEYRAITPYWTARLTRRQVTHAAFSCGYSIRGRFVRPVTKIDIGFCPYPGWTGDFYRVHLEPLNAQA